MHVPKSRATGPSCGGALSGWLRRSQRPFTQILSCHMGTPPDNNNSMIVPSRDTLGTVAPAGLPQPRSFVACGHTSDRRSSGPPRATRDRPQTSVTQLATVVRPAPWMWDRDAHQPRRGHTAVAMGPTCSTAAQDSNGSSRPAQPQAVGNAHRSVFLREKSEEMGQTTTTRAQSVQAVPPPLWHDGAGVSHVSALMTGRPACLQRIGREDCRQVRTTSVQAPDHPPRCARDSTPNAATVVG